MNSVLQDIAKGARESQETLAELQNELATATDEYTAAVAATNEARRLLTVANGKVELQKKVLVDYLTDMHDISLAGLERISQ